MASLSNILLSKTYIKTGGDTINFSFNVADADSLTTKYQIYLDDVLLKENSLTATPYDVNGSIVLSTGGVLKITLITSTDVITDWTYDIYSEDRDTFTLIRRMEYDTSNTMNNAIISSGTGIMLDTGKTTAEVLTEIPTIGKSKLSSVAIDGITSETSTANVITQSTGTVDLTDYVEYTFPVVKTKYDSINSFAIDDANNSLVMNVTMHNTKTVQISKDGISFFGYNGSSWDSEYIMTEAEFEALTSVEYLKFHTNAYEERLFVKIYLDSNNTVTPMTLTGITAIYSPNEPPIAQDTTLSLSLIHDEETVLTSYLYDNEGDTIEYQVLIKSPGDADYRQVTPETGWISVDNKTNITHVYDKTNFTQGDNLIKIQMRDQRGSIRDSNVLTLQFVNESPIQTSYVCGDFSLQALIRDDNNDTLAYRIFINGVQKYPVSGYTSYQPSPRLIDFSWDSSDLKFGLSNEIKLEIIDGYKGSLTLTSNVLGTYKGLLFKDELGNYHSTDRGQILKYIDLGKYIASSITTPKKVVLENRTGGKIGNVKIRVSADTVYDGVDMNISPALTPFNGTKEITIPYVLNDKDEFDFYVRVALDRHVQKTGDTFLKLEVE